jgi:hypothetical protein
MDIIDIHISLRAAIDDALARAVAIAGLVVIALIHVLQAPDAFDEAGYVGALFIAAAVACVLVAAGMTRTSDSRAWIAAGALAGLILLGYIISRSVGLPGFTDDVGEWSEPAGLASMVVESFVVLLAGGTLASGRFPVPGARRSAARAGTPASAGPAVG